MVRQTDIYVFCQKTMLLSTVFHVELKQMCNFLGSKQYSKEKLTPNEYFVMRNNQYYTKQCFITYNQLALHSTVLHQG